MKKSRKLVVSMSALVLVAATSIGVYAAENMSPAQTLSELTGISIEELYEAKGDQTFGALAQELEVEDAFRTDMVGNKLAIIEERVIQGTLTREVADEMIAVIIENQENCDKTGLNQGDQRLGLGFGHGNGMGTGERVGGGRGFGSRNGLGQRQGLGLRNN
ncbi:MAG: hypothetical protein CVU95_07295 [Firmicutes bacterium HGW-Firmicutes-2]|jgi:hypothetical protein|nr:MAG: hypothetical protein CVU95_07295 [Firmicutes bacterium HGW-Firmicutes-2]